MERCMSCGKIIILGSSFGRVSLCRTCSSIINASAWNKRNFSTIEALICQKEDAIQRAIAGNFPQNIINEITSYFDAYIEDGFVGTINGKAGQTLKVFSNYCIVTTKSEDKKTELEHTFHLFDDSEDDEDEKELFSSDDKRNLVHGLMSGRVVQAGIGAAISATINHQEKSKSESKKYDQKLKKARRLISVGERKIDLRKISQIETFAKTNYPNGYLRFVNKGNIKHNPYDCEYFFFNNSIPFESKKIKQKVETIKNSLNDRIAAIEKEEQIVTINQEKKKTQKQTVKQSKTDVFEEVRKFKQLMDEGIITQEEFETKKKELLDL